MRKTYLIFALLIITFPTFSNDSDSLIKSNQKQLYELEKEVDSLENELKNLKISKEYFDIVVGSQWNIFSTIIAILIAVFTIGLFKFFLRDFVKYKKQQEQHEKVIKSIEKKAYQSYFNSQRAYFTIQKERKNFKWAAISAFRCMDMSFYTQNPNGVITWLKNFEEMFDKITDKRKFVKSFEEEIFSQLNYAMKVPGIESEIYIEELNRVKQKIKSSR